MASASSILSILFLFIHIVSSSNLFHGYEWNTGYISMHPSKESKVFYYLFKSKASSTAPLLVWIGGGPGCSAANFLFLESGPYTFDAELKYKPNPYSWTNKTDVLYLDFPFSTGLSANDYDVYPLSNVNFAAEELKVFFYKFLDRHTEYTNNKILFACEGYSCQIVTKFAAECVKRGKHIAGLLLRNPMIDYSIQSTWPQFAHSLGRLSFVKFPYYSLIFSLCKASIGLGLSHLITSLCDPQMEKVAEEAQIHCLDNVKRKDCYEREYAVLTDFMINENTQKSLDLPQHRPFTICNSTVRYYLNSELKAGNSKDIGILLNNKVDVKIVYGELNYLFNWEGGLKMAEEIEWNGKDAFKRNEMKEEEECGRSKKEGPLKFVILKNAGQLIGRENPKCWWKAYNEFIE